MRALTPRLVLPSLVCATLVLGPAGAAVAADVHHATPGHSALDIAERSVADADALLDRLGTPYRTDYDRALAPLVDTATAIADGAGAHLDAAEAAGYAQALRTASETVQERLNAAEATVPGEDAVHRAADPVSDATATVQSAVEALLKALTSLDLPGVLGGVVGLVSSVVGVVTGLLGGGLPALPPLPAAPPLPALPAAP